MEVFMRNIPNDLTENSFRAQLEPFMDALSIKDYHCNKSKKKTFGHVTFLNREDGERFLHQHGQEEMPGGLLTQNAYNQRGERGRPSRLGPKGRSRDKANLVIMGKQVYCVISDRRGENKPDGYPDPMTLRGLMYAAEERENESTAPKKDDRNGPVNFDLLSSSCGYCVFLDGRLTFVPEVDWNVGGTMKFTKHLLLVKLSNGLIVRISLSSVVELIWSPQGLLTLVLHTTPSFFEDNSLFAEAGGAGQQLLTLLTGLTLQSHEPKRIRLCSFDDSHANVVGQCLVYQFKVVTQELYQKMKQLVHHNTMAITSHGLAVRSVQAQLGGFSAQMEILNRELETLEKNDALPFGILFQLQALACNAYLHPGTVLALAKELRRTFVADKSAGRRPISVDAMKMLFEKIDYPLPNGEPLHLEADFLMKLLRKNEDEIHSGYLMPRTSNLARINRVMVTPTRITFHGPEFEAQNRILRKFPKHHDKFIRVQFCEEDGSDLRFNAQVDIESVYSRFRKVLGGEIRIAGRKYTFLGFSHSSLRAHSVWFSCPFLDDNNKHQTYSTIISELGNFSQIRSPAKCAARIGQAFSETPFAVPLEENNITVEEIPDLKTSDGTRVFSDGVGTMSWDVMVRTWDYISQSKNSPSCFQVRLGGAKGMLALDSRLSGSVIRVRDSMIKFPTEDMKNLEICDTASKPISLVLNRQLVKILEDIKVPASWFFKLQNQELEHLRSITANASNTADFLKAKRVGESFGLHKLVRFCDGVGIDYRKDDFLRSVVEAAVLRVLRLLKHKARIPVNQGITLFGVMDETGYLEEGEVFVTYDTMAGRYPPPPGPGRVLVSRSPALHPGDVQIARNIIPPEGHPFMALSNCIVFSSKGSRDLPSQLSGGDLDGDIYHIIWDPEARPAETCQPADYPRPTPLDIGRSITKTDMADFFVEFMKADQLGLIATRHMILADQKVTGTLDPNCLTLAEMHSTAVDFSKTGIPVDMTRLPRSSKFRPDFLAPGPQARLIDKSQIDLEMHTLPEVDEDEEDDVRRNKYYKSEKLLGHLYRAVDERKIWAEDIHSEVKTGGSSFWDQFLLLATQRCDALGCSRWTGRMEEARRIRSAYEGAIFSAMGDFSEHPTQPLTELEVFTGNIFNSSGVQTHRQRDKSTKLREEFDRIGSWITDQIRMRGIPLTGYMTELNALELCLACVYVGREREGTGSVHSRRDDYGDLNSFSVVAATALVAELRLFSQGVKGGNSTSMKGLQAKPGQTLPN